MTQHDDDEFIPNFLRKGAKQPFHVTLRLIECFAATMPIRECAEFVGVSPKTVRETYTLLRARLMEPAFARWHPRNIQYLRQADKDEEEARWQIFLPLLTKCYHNRTCLDNYQRGKRQHRICRSCPIKEYYKNDENLEQVNLVADSSREFYDHFGWGPERSRDPASLLEERITHETVLMEAESHSQRTEDGLLVIRDDDNPMSLGAVVRVFIAQLADRPL